MVATMMNQLTQIVEREFRLSISILASRTAMLAKIINPQIQMKSGRFLNETMAPIRPAANANDRIEYRMNHPPLKSTNSSYRTPLPPKISSELPTVTSTRPLLAEATNSTSDMFATPPA